MHKAFVFAIRLLSGLIHALGWLELELTKQPLDFQIGPPCGFTVAEERDEENDSESRVAVKDEAFRFSPGLEVFAMSDQTETSKIAHFSVPSARKGLTTLTGIALCFVQWPQIDVNITAASETIC